MQRLDKSNGQVLSTGYRRWLNRVPEPHPATYNYYYDDVVMNLYKCQRGVCAYTEINLCIPELYDDINWVRGRFKIPAGATYNRKAHLGELDHYNPQDKSQRYWNWNNLFMIHAKVNSIKSDNDVVDYLKPDIDGYSPEAYFDYEPETNLFIPNTDIDDPVRIAEIKNMIDNVLCLNHGVIKNERRDYINMLRNRWAAGEDIPVTKFFTAVRWVLQR